MRSSAFSVVWFLVLAFLAPRCGAESPPAAQIQLRSESWDFSTTQAACSMLGPEAPQAEFSAPAHAADGFTVKATLNLKKSADQRQLLEIPGVLLVTLRQHDPRDRQRQNYPAGKLPDGSVPVLEARLRLASAEHPDWKEMTIGVPLALLKQPAGEHELVLNFSGPRWTLYIDGELLDNDFPFGAPPWAPHNTWKLDRELVKRAALYVPALTPHSRPAAQPRRAAVQYWTPPGHNAWVGDVATLFHDGRYHVFYLYDRRHHQSKFGKGAHYFEHLSTSDLRTWTEHAAATPLEEQWECIGTGTPFVDQGQLCIAYGLHTARVYPAARTTWPAQWDYLKQHGCTGEFRRADTPGVPAGATYARSADGGATFVKSQIMFHPCQNPSVYRDPSGTLRMLANSGSRGIWESESVNGGWRCLSPDFPPGGDCTFFFRWGPFDYIVGGFKNLWCKPADAPDNAYADMADRGRDVYDGLNVPAITEISGGRFLMAGWTHVRGWGGNLVIRELRQFPDGRLGSRWVPELMPETAAPQTLAAEIGAAQTFPCPGQSFLLTFEVQPAGTRPGRLGLALLPASDGQLGCELQLQLDERRAQFGPAAPGGFAGRQKSLREGGAPHAGGNYAIENLIDVERPFTVRVIVKTDPKLGGTLIDAEIAGQRTMLSYRADLTVEKLVFRNEGVTLRNAQLAVLKN